jgi:signal transduction histidine kinase
LSRFDPSSDFLMPAPSVRIHALRVNGAPQPVPALGESDIGELALSSSQRQIQVEFAGFGPGLRYQTFLSGVDADWTVPSPEPAVHYVSLAPGAYELRIRTLTPDGVASPQSARLRFRIAAPVWQRWWFLSLAAIAVAFSAYMSHRWRLQRLLEVERIRTRIATDLHDDIGTGLSQIALLGELAQRSFDDSVDSSTAPNRDILARMVALSREMVESMSDIVWAINPKRDRLSDLTYRMRRFAADHFAAGDIRLRFQGPGEDADHRLPADVRREVFLIFKESIYNVVRHSSCSAVDVEFTVESGCLLLQVSDNGAGFAEADHPTGHGLQSMHSRAERLSGRLEIHSGADGTTVRLWLPLAVRRHQNR